MKNIRTNSLLLSLSSLLLLVWRPTSAIRNPFDGTETIWSIINTCEDSDVEICGCQVVSKHEMPEIRTLYKQELPCDELCVPGTCSQTCERSACSWRMGDKGEMCATFVEHYKMLFVRAASCQYDESMLTYRCEKGQSVAFPDEQTYSSIARGNCIPACGLNEEAVECSFEARFRPETNIHDEDRQFPPYVTVLGASKQKLSPSPPPSLSPSPSPSPLPLPPPSPEEKAAEPSTPPPAPVEEPSVPAPEPEVESIPAPAPVEEPSVPAPEPEVESIPAPAPVEEPSVPAPAPLEGVRDPASGPAEDSLSAPTPSEDEIALAPDPEEPRAPAPEEIKLLSRQFELIPGGDAVRNSSENFEIMFIVWAALIFLVIFIMVIIILLLLRNRSKQKEDQLLST